MALSLVPAGGAVVTFFHFVTMAPAVSVFSHAFHINGSRRVFGSFNDVDFLSSKSAKNPL